MGWNLISYIEQSTKYKSILFLSKGLTQDQNSALPDPFTEAHARPLMKQWRKIAAICYA
jgi:hypothetical protein